MGPWLLFTSSFALLCLSHLLIPSGFMKLRGGRCTIRVGRLRLFTPILTALRDALATLGAMKASALQKKRDLCVTCSDHWSMPWCTPYLRLFIPSRAAVKLLFWGIRARFSSCCCRDKTVTHVSSCVALSRCAQEISQIHCAFLDFVPALKRDC